MPNRKIVNGEPYRYAYQGQEKDPETGKEAFQLRLWDSRIGRWLSPDPYRQYYSPYLGMGNDPINGIDPDGGYKTKWDRFWGWVGGGFKGSFTSSDNPGTEWHKYGIVKNTGDGELTFDFGLNNGGRKELLDYGYQTNGTNYFNSGSGFMRATKVDWVDNWSESNNILAKFSYETIDGVSVIGQTLNPFDNQLTRLNGNGIARGSNEHLDLSVNTAATFIPTARGSVSGVKGLGYVGKLNTAQFSKVFKGNLSKLSPKLRGFTNKYIINSGIKWYNNQIGNGVVLLKLKSLAPKDN